MTKEKSVRSSHLIRPRLSAALLSVALSLAVGCTQPQFNKTPTVSESSSISDVIQLSHGFERAGEAYFSRDMKWIIFQAAPRGEQQYQMFVAPLIYEVTRESRAPGAMATATPLPNLTVPSSTDIIRIGEPIRISPEKSRNTCGYFSPDGDSLIFASTAGKDDPTEPAGGYQRDTGTYRWPFSPGMDIFRADGWKGAISAAAPGQIVDLAKHRLTDNDTYDAECDYSPDGKWIVFCSLRTGDPELFAMRSDGTGVVQLTSIKGYDGGPFFSPDGKRVVYRSDRSGNGLLQIFVSDVVFDANGNITALQNERPLTHDANVNWGPFWHPDGKHIIYATSIHGHANYELYLMRADGSLKTRITLRDGPDLLPAFSPDGRYLMWCSRRSTDKSPQIFVAKFKLPPGS